MMIFCTVNLIQPFWNFYHIVLLIFPIVADERTPKSCNFMQRPSEFSQQWELDTWKMRRLFKIPASFFFLNMWLVQIQKLLHSQNTLLLPLQLESIVLRECEIPVFPAWTNANGNEQVMSLRLSKKKKKKNFPQWKFTQTFRNPHRLSFINFDVIPANPQNNQLLSSLDRSIRYMVFKKKLGDKPRNKQKLQFVLKPLIKVIPRVPCNFQNTYPQTISCRK